MLLFYSISFIIIIFVYSPFQIWKGFVLRPVSDDPNSTDAIYVVESDLKGNIPKAALGSAQAKQVGLKLRFRIFVLFVNCVWPLLSSLIYKAFQRLFVVCFWRSNTNTFYNKKNKSCLIKTAPYFGCNSWNSRSTGSQSVCAYSSYSLSLFVW